MTHEEFYNAAKKLVDGLDCYYISANVRLTKYSYNEDAEYGFNITYQFGDLPDPIVFCSDYSGKTQEASLTEAEVWIQDNKDRLIFKHNPSDHIET